MIARTNVQAKIKWALRWGALLVPLVLCGLLLTAITSSQQEDDSTRRSWDKQFEEARAKARGQTVVNPSATNTKPQTTTPPKPSPGATAAGTANEELIGVTFWRLRPATNDNSAQPRLSVKHRGVGIKSYRLERADTETPFREGEMVRFSVETTRADNHYLYVINREVYADKTMGDPYLIFPARATPPGGNVIAAGKLVYVPAQGDPVPYFTLQRKRPDHVSEMLTLILSPEPLPLIELPASGAPLNLDAALVKKWEQQWGGPTERRESRGGAGKEWTKAEQEADRGQGVLAQGDPLPQTIYRVNAKVGGQAIFAMPLKIGLSAQAKDEAARNKPMLVVQLGHTRNINSVVFSPDGRLIATGGNDDTVLWEAATGREIRRFGFSATSIVFSPDGQFILAGRVLSTGKEEATARDHIASLWNLSTGREVRRFAGHSKYIRSVAFSPGGRFTLTGSDDQTVRLWDTSTGEEVKRFLGNTGSVTSVAFSQDGSHILAGCGSTARIWDVSTGKEIHKFVHSGKAGNISVAFSPDGRRVLTADSSMLYPSDCDVCTIRLWNVSTGKEEGSFKEYGPAVFSPDGRYVLGGSQTLWDVSTRKQLKQFEGAEGDLTAIAFSPDSRLALMVFSEVAGGGSSGATVGRVAMRLYDIDSGKEGLRFEAKASEVHNLAFYRNNSFFLSGHHLWDLTTGAIVFSLHPETDHKLFENNGGSQTIRYLQANLDLDGTGRRLLTADSIGAVYNQVSVWDTITGKRIQRIGGRSFYSAKLSPNGRFIATAAYNGVLSLWNVSTGKAVWRYLFSDHVSKASLWPDAVRFSPDGRFILLRRDHLVLMDAATGKLVWPVDMTDYADFSPDGRFIALNREVTVLFDRHTRKEVRRFRGGLGAFSPDGQLIATQDGKTTILWSVPTGKEMRRFDSSSAIPVLTTKISPDNRFILIENGVWNISAGKKIWQIDNLKNSIEDETGRRSMESTFSPDGRFVVGTLGNIACWWWTSTGEELCRLISLQDGTYLVVTPDGRFDTDNLEVIEGLHWVVPDDPFRPLPLEIFMREYYEPKLLPRLLVGERLKPTKPISNLNRVQPQVKITEIKPQAGESNIKADKVTATIEVASTTGTFTRDGKQVTLESGVYDLRLFRDGQLVGYAPEQDGPVKLESGKATITFKDIKLPRRADLKQVEFSAYAFNVDRVKSETARKTYVLPRPLPAVKGRAYVIAVGVNAYENAAFDLGFAANDARRLQGVLSEKLKATGEYEEVVPITLLSDYEWKDGRRTITVEQATKGNVKLALDLLAGRPVDPAWLAGIANADKLRPARPEDLVILSFASHGYADEVGRFYFVTYDTGAGAGRAITPDVLQKSISSDELSRWLRDVDAGELVMIVDACQSAAAVEGEGFKPGPMGSRGLGQLAYDKGMRILAATQADNAALEHGLIRQGLLTYALVRDGIELGRADFKPEDKTIALGEWLEYARDRVPQLFAEVRSGQVRSSGSGAPGVVDAPKVILLPQKNAPTSQAGPTRLLLQGKPLGASGKLTLAEEQIQQPALFDYARKRRDALLLRK